MLQRNVEAARAAADEADLERIMRAGLGPMDTGDDEALWVRARHEHASVVNKGCPPHRILHLRKGAPASGRGTTETMRRMRACVRIGGRGWTHVESKLRSPRPGGGAQETEGAAGGASCSGPILSPAFACTETRCTHA